MSVPYPLVFKLLGLISISAGGRGMIKEGHKKTQKKKKKRKKKKKKKKKKRSQWRAAWDKSRMIATDNFNPKLCSEIKRKGKSHSFFFSLFFHLFRQSPPKIFKSKLWP